MDNFFGRMGLDLGNSLGTSFGHSLGSSIGHSITSATSTPEELRIGSHNIVVSHKIAEGNNTAFSFSRLFSHWFSLRWIWCD